MELSGAASLSRLPRTCLVKIQAVYPTLKKAERRAADLLLADSGAITGATIVEAARLAGCSETTWVRLSQRLGYGGFLTLKASLAGRLRGDDALDEPAIVSFYDDVGPDTPSLEIARRVLDSSVNALNDTFRLIDEEKYDRAVRALSGASKVVLCGAGDAYAVVRSAYQKFFRAGLNVYANSDIDLQLIAIGNLRAGDVLLAVSYSGRTRSVLEQVKYARQKGCTVLAVTNFPVSPLTKNADIALLTAAFTKHARGEIVSKRVAQLFLIESLYVNLLMKSRADLSHNIQRADESIGVNKL